MRTPSMFFVIGVGIGLTTTLLCSPVGAQDEPELPKPPVFARLFPQPTGMNGYEEWVQACDLIRNNKLADAATEPGASLTLKRQLMADPQVQQALHLLREGLNKPSASPRQTVDETTPFPELSLFRKLARLLNTHIYVCFADGRVDTAIDALSDGLRFGYRMQTDSLISGLVGIAIDAIVLKGFSAHLDMLSDYQCARIQRLVEVWVEWPSPAARLLHQEKQATIQSLENKRTDLKGLEEMINLSYSDDENGQEDVKNMLAYLKLHPLELGPAIDQAKGLLVAHYDAAVANLNRPVKERVPMDNENAKSLGGKLFSLVTANVGPIVEKYDRTNAMVRLLGVHAAIRRYRWEHNSLPTSLSQLHLGPLTTDPFTGEIFKYQQTGAGYDLYSQGPQETSEAGLPTGKRTPVRL